VTPHTHITPIHLGAGVIAVVAILGTAHLLALSNDNRVSRALFALGF